MCSKIPNNSTVFAILSMPTSCAILTVAVLIERSRASLIVVRSRIAFPKFFGFQMPFFSPRSISIGLASMIEFGEKPLSKAVRYTKGLITDPH